MSQESEIILGGRFRIFVGSQGHGMLACTHFCLQEWLIGSVLLVSKEQALTLSIQRSTPTSHNHPFRVDMSSRFSWQCEVFPLLEVPRCPWAEWVHNLRSKLCEMPGCLRHSPDMCECQNAGQIVWAGLPSIEKHLFVHPKYLNPQAAFPPDLPTF